LHKGVENVPAIARIRDDHVGTEAVNVSSQMTNGRATETARSIEVTQLGVIEGTDTNAA
jgi:hypothetical protein